jgi:hypothetical protein
MDDIDRTSLETGEYESDNSATRSKANARARILGRNVRRMPFSEAEGTFRNLRTRQRAISIGSSRLREAKGISTNTLIDDGLIGNVDESWSVGFPHTPDMLFLVASQLRYACLNTSTGRHE